MSVFSKIEIKSEQEVIQILQENGIQVIMKPMALIPDNLNYDGIGRQSIGIIEADIYDALNKLERMKRIVKDPFS